MGTAIGAVIDYCVAGATPVIAAVDPTCEVADSWPTSDAAGYLIIARQDVDSGQAADGDTAWYDLGAQRIEETFTVDCHIEVTRPGPGLKPARDAAIAVFDAFVGFVKADPTLGQTLTRGRVAIAGRIALTQTPSEDNEERGCQARLSFQLACKNTYL